VDVGLGVELMGALVGGNWVEPEGIKRKREKKSKVHFCRQVNSSPLLLTVGAVVGFAVGADVGIDVGYEVV
jgi:hypothetical protein